MQNKHAAWVGLRLGGRSSFCSLQFLMGGKPSKKGVATKTAHKGAREASLKGHKDAVLCCAFSPDGKLLATGSADRSVMIWDVPAFTKRHRLENEHSHSEPVTGVSFSPDSTLLISGRRFFFVRQSI